MDKAEIRRERSRALRYKRPALESMGYFVMMDELETIQSECDEVRYFLETDDGGGLLEETVGDEDEAYEFKMAFSDLSASAEDLSTAIYDNGIQGDDFDDCTVALIGNRYNLVGYDSFEEDYYSLTGYEQDLATTEAGKRLMKLTKQEMIASIGQCLGTLLAFYDLRQKYDYLKATMDIIRDENVSVLRVMKGIDKMYDKAMEKGRYSEEMRDYDRLLAALPARVWVE